MPNLNGTGPLGQGSFTGWGRGKCLGNNDNEEIDIEKPETKNINFEFGRRRIFRGTGNGKRWMGGWYRKRYWKNYETENPENEKSGAKNIVLGVGRGGIPYGGGNGRCWGGGRNRRHIC